MSFYGIFKHNKEFAQLSKKERNAFLLEHGLYESLQSISVKTQTSLVSMQDFVNAIKNEKRETVLQPKNELAESLYWFLVNYFNDPIQARFVDFCLQFDREVIGLTKKKKKKLALQYYKEKKEHFLIKGLSLIAYDKDSRPINHNIFKIIKARRTALVNQVCKYDDIMNAYLIGDLQVIKSKLTTEWEEYKYIVEFEHNLKAILFLNELYEFEEDHYFNTKQLKEQDAIKAKSFLKVITSTHKPKPKNEITQKEAIDYLLKHHFNKN